MDGNRFDEIAENLAANASRRRLVAGLLGGAALLTGAVASLGDVNAKKGQGKAKGKGRGKAHGKNKVAICHKTGNGAFELKNVPTPALKGHLKHGDTRCEVGVCQTGEATACGVDGSCTFANAVDGTVCEAGGAAGTCQAGVCVI